MLLSTHVAVALLMPPPLPRAQIRMQMSDDDKIARAQYFLQGQGFYGKPKPELFADDYVFRASVVGPLCKSDYLETMNLFALWEAVPDMQANAYGWCVDPSDPSTVRFYVRNTGTHTGPLNVGSVVIPPSGKPYEGTTESWAVTLDADGLVKKHTVGYVVDRFAGNGGGLGAVYGVLVAIGLPVPKPGGKVFAFSQWLGNTFGTTFGPRTISAEADIPAWYTSRERGTDGL